MFTITSIISLVIVCATVINLEVKTFVFCSRDANFVLLGQYHKFSNAKLKCLTNSNAKLKCLTNCWILITLFHPNQLVRFLAENFSKHSRRAALFLPAVVRWQLLWQRAAAMRLTLQLKLR
jgi:hypothetical protein